MEKSQPFKELPAALAKFQGEITNPKMSKNNPYFNSKYAPLDEILKLVRPVLSKFGLSVHQDVSTHKELHDHVVIITTLFHESGEWLESSPMVLPAYQKLKDGRKEFNAQGAGSSITYSRRYQLQATLGIAADSDDDGEEQSHPSNQYVPRNQVSTPTKQTLAAKFQLVMGTRDGFDEYCNKLYAKGHDDKYISLKLDEALEVKKQKEQSA